MEEGSYKLPEDKQFSFTLKPYGDDNPDKGAWVNAGNPDEPEELKELEKTAAAVTIPKGTKEYAKEGYEASFPEITFTKSGTYKFQITEDGVDEKPPGNLNLKRKLPGICLRMQPSASALPLERRTRTAYSFLTVADVTYAKAGKVVEGAQCAVFENVYETRATAFTPTVQKKITGDKTPDEKIFWFTLETDENNPEGAELQTIQTCVKGEGTASFGDITFKKAGTYKFYLKEKNGGEKGYTYDTSRWMLTVTVQDQDSILTVTRAAYTKVGELLFNTEAARFQNKYTAEKTAGTKTNTTKTTTTRKVKTGDTAHTLLWIALMSASALTGAGIVNRKRRKKKNEIQMYCGISRFTMGEKKDTATMQITHTMFALEKARSLPRNSIWFYDLELHQEEILQNYVETHMNQALEAGEFKMYLQPKFNLQTGDLAGAEALVRWIPEDGKVIYPGQFIPIFENNGFCASLDMYMTEQVCRQLRQWQTEGVPLLPISVNQSKILFYEADYVERMEKLIRKYQIPAGWITLEILEGLAMENIDKLNQVIVSLKKIGFRISMDDFGSGYSSLNTLGNLRIDELKLDKGFLQELEGADYKRQKIIIKHIIDLSKSLKISTVAEGIETEENRRMVRDLGCDLGQGYYYCRPVSAGEFNQKYMKKGEV